MILKKIDFHGLIFQIIKQKTTESWNSRLLLWFWKKRFLQVNFPYHKTKNNRII